MGSQPSLNHPICITASQCPSLNTCGSHVNGTGLFPTKRSPGNDLPYQSSPSEAGGKDGHGRHTEGAKRVDSEEVCVGYGDME